MGVRGVTGASSYHGELGRIAASLEQLVKLMTPPAKKLRQPPPFQYGNDEPLRFTDRPIPFYPVAPPFTVSEANEGFTTQPAVGVDDQPVTN